MPLPSERTVSKDGVTRKFWGRGRTSPVVVVVTLIESQVGIWDRLFFEAKNNAIKFAVHLVVASLNMTVF